MMRALSFRRSARPLALAATIPALLLAAACDRGESPEIRAQREAAFRQACASRTLALQAEGDYEMIAAGLQSEDALTRMATTAAIGFNQAYLNHANIRYAAYAHLDSAVNYAKTPTDSAAYIARALSFGVASPETGSLEESVINDYDGKLQRLLMDRNHQCNWDFPF
jgi:hypothetical protein